MSRRIQCNTLSVKPKPDGTCGNIECETLHCKSFTCDEEQPNALPKTIRIPYSLMVSHINLGMIGTCVDDLNVQSRKSPVDFESKKIEFLWNDWNHLLDSQNLYYKINNGDWLNVQLSSNQTLVEYTSSIKDSDDITIEVYAQSCDDYDIQSLSVNICGDYVVNL